MALVANPGILRIGWQAGRSMNFVRLANEWPPQTLVRRRYRRQGRWACAHWDAQSRSGQHYPVPGRDEESPSQSPGPASAPRPVRDIGSGILDNTAVHTSAYISNGIRDHHSDAEALAPAAASNVVQPAGWFGRVMWAVHMAAPSRTR